MNFVQHYFKLPLAIVYKEDKKDYFDALQQTRKQENMEIFYSFMTKQYEKFLKTEMKQYRKDMSTTLPKKKQTGKGKGLSLFF